MRELDLLYIELLVHGIVSIRNASLRGDIEYCKYESEHLHEVPALIGMAEVGPHKYYASQMRRAYLEWVATCGREDVREFVKIYYAPSWVKLDRLLGLDQSDWAYAPGGSGD